MELLGGLYCRCTPSIRIVESEAHGVNDLRQVVGFAPILAMNSKMAFIWENGEMQPLQGFNDSPIFKSRAFDINNQGQVVGEYQDILPAGPIRQLTAFIWDAGSVQFLPTLLRYETSRAVSINEKGDAVGW